MLKEQGICYNDMEGYVLVSNYRILFKSNDKFVQYEIITLGYIMKIERKAKKVHLQGWDYYISKIKCTEREQGKRIENIIMNMAYRDRITDLFAFSYYPEWCYINEQERKLQKLNWIVEKHINEKYAESSLLFVSDYNINMDGMKIFNMIKDFDRIGIQWGNYGERGRWRICNINKDYEECPTYPNKFVVPASVSDDMVRECASFRKRRRLPVLCWQHKNQASINRSSQPKIGLSNRCEDDIKYLYEMKMTNPNDSDGLRVLDSRPWANAEANRARGGGYELFDQYNIEVGFHNIANIHSVRSAYSIVHSLCNGYKHDKSWYTELGNSQLLYHVKCILNGANDVVKLVEGGTSVLIHCSDGWDRTSQVSSLAQLMLDPHYRTITGFCELIEKEWISFGHRFRTRLGFSDINYSDTNRSPIFPQFLDCVFQLLRHFPTSFEFNEEFLIVILNESYNCKFGTFLCDNDKNRNHYKIKTETTSLWSFIHRRDNFYNYKNPLYMPPHGVSIMTHFGTPSQIVIKFEESVGVKDIVLWEKFFMRNVKSNVNLSQGDTLLNRVVEMKTIIEMFMMQMQEINNNEKYQCIIEDLKNKLYAEGNEGIQPFTDLIMNISVLDTNQRLSLAVSPEPVYREDLFSQDDLPEHSESIMVNSRDLTQFIIDEYL
eukprot:TRINITY_DN2639_c0_g1_i1.p1 TRINITY_DN2639_c0_g1~~TRINITY_DN2639_c0_g1_i1.p1  ORF type:complete len:661 (+),score=114.37 TRINITY_DN2639_c0_g1_i1:379-2361(+)